MDFCRAHPSHEPVIVMDFDTAAKGTEIIEEAIAAAEKTL